MNAKKILASAVIATTSLLGVAGVAHADTLEQRNARWYSYQQAQLDKWYSEVAPTLIAHNGPTGDFNPAANAPCWLQDDNTVACGDHLTATSRRAWVNADGTVSGL